MVWHFGYLAWLGNENLLDSNYTFHGVITGDTRRNDQRQSNQAVSHREPTTNYYCRIVIEHVYMERKRSKKMSFLLKAKPEGGKS